MTDTTTFTYPVPTATDLLRIPAGRAACRQAARPCLVCGEPSVCRAGLCHTHQERWRRWGKPSPAEWAAAFREGRLNTCAVCGRHWNGYHGCRHCSPECRAAWKREVALARYHALSPEAKREAVHRSLARGRARRAARVEAKPCAVCGTPFEGFPHQILCGRPRCRARNTTRGSRAYRDRRAAREAAELGAELERRLTDGPTP